MLPSDGVGGMSLSKGDTSNAGPREAGEERSHVPEDGPPSGATAGERAPLIAIGASAGGLEALKRLLGALQEDANLSIVVVQHLSPTHDSLLTSALHAATPLGVVEVRDGMRLAAGQVHVIPPNAALVLEGDHLRLHARDEAARPPMPIDTFMRSVAAQRGAGAVGIVLSGTGSDGTLGLTAIRAAGGRTYAQEPSTAVHDGMPRSAIAADAVDLILPPEAIAADVVALARGAPAPSDGERAHEPEADDAFRQILHLLKVRTAVDVSHYKPSTLRRRIARRMTLAHVAAEPEYLRRLRDEPQELNALHDDLFIHVTSFFRDPEVFTALEEHVFPAMLAGRGKEAPIRLWVPGCSTGEETYSLAIAAREFLERNGSDVPIQVFGTDISERAIRVARAGEFPAGIAEQVSQERLARFFEQNAKGYRIVRPLREACVFVRHDLTADPPFSRIDLLSCRNVLIYFDAVLQKQVMPLFHYALNEPGFLLLGRTESLAGFGEYFSLVDQGHKIYARRAGAGRVRAATPRMAGIERGVTAGVGSLPRAVQDLHRGLDVLLLARYVPAAVLVNDALDIVQVRGKTGPYLEPAPGIASLSLLKMARNGLGADLTQLVHRARTENAPVRKDGVRVHGDGGVTWVDLEVAPVDGVASAGRHFVVVFRERGPPPEPALATTTGTATATDAAGIAELRQELSASKLYVTTVMEQYAVGNQALAESNEELQATNEELQSANEELETAKEELQSTNEELTTVNDELQARYQEVNDLGNDLLNLVTSADIPIVIVDRERKVRRFTPNARAAFNLIPADLGRPITDIRPNVDAPELDAWIAEVIETVSVKEVEVRDRDGRWQRIQIRPYQTADRRIDGAVVSLVDVDALRRAVTEARHSRDFVAAALETVPVPVLVLDPRLRVTSANQAFYDAFRVAPAAAAGRPMAELGVGPWRSAALAARLRDAVERGDPFADLEAEYDVPDGGRRVAVVAGRVVPAALDEARSIILAVQDVTERRRMQEEQARARTEEAQRFQNEAGAAMLPESLDYAATLATLAHLVVPRLADWCIVDLVAADGAIQQAAVAHVDPAKEQRARTLRRRLAPEAQPERGVAWVIQTGKPALHPDIDDLAWLAGALGSEHPEFLRELGARSYLSVPLRGRKGVIGAITLVRGIPGRRFGPEDLAAAEGLGQRAGLAVENARLYLSARDALVARDEFLAILSHELRNPLAALRNSIHVLDRADPASGHAGRARDIANRQIGHLTRLVDDLLDVTRIAHGKIELRRTDLEFGDVVRRTAEDHRALMEARGIRLTVETPPEPLVVEGDLTRLAQVVGNLLQNSAKFTGPAGSVAVSLANAEGMAELRVRDTGAGIEAGLLKDLFTPFTQAKQTLARTEGGLGLGLAFVKGLVELHGGTVDATSEGPGRGAEFRIRLPLVVSPRTPKRERAGANPTPAARRRVLIVDDNADAAESLADLVRMLGHDVDVAFNGPAAIERVRRGALDIVLCDIGLPGMSGYEVARTLRADGGGASGPKLVALSGYALPEDVKRATDAGFDAHLAKPADLAQLERLLE